MPTKTLIFLSPISLFLQGCQINLGYIKPACDIKYISCSSAPGFCLTQEPGRCVFANCLPFPVDTHYCTNTESDLFPYVCRYDKAELDCNMGNSFECVGNSYRSTPIINCTKGACRTALCTAPNEKNHGTRMYIDPDNPTLLTSTQHQYEEPVADCACPNQPDYLTPIQCRPEQDELPYNCTMPQ